MAKPWSFPENVRFFFSNFNFKLKISKILLQISIFRMKNRFFLSKISNFVVEFDEYLLYWYWYWYYQYLGCTGAGLVLYWLFFWYWYWYWLANSGTDWAIISGGGGLPKFATKYLIPVEHCPTTTVRHHVTISFVGIRSVIGMQCLNTTHCNAMTVQVVVTVCGIWAIARGCWCCCWFGCYDCSRGCRVRVIAILTLKYHSDTGKNQGPISRKSCRVLSCKL